MACTICGDTPEQSFLARNEGDSRVFRYRQCLGCGLAYLDAAARTDLASYYATEYRPGSGDYVGGSRTLLTRLLEANFDRVGQRIESMVGCGRILDVGCGAGVFLSVMARRGWQSVGVEPNVAYSEALRQKRELTIYTGVLDSIPDSCPRFDAVTLFDVIEHLPDPAKVLTDIQRWLRPGGVLAVTTPNLLSFERRLFGSYWYGLQPPDHLWLFSLASLHRVIEEAGYETLVDGRSPVSYAWPSLRMRIGVRPRPGLAETVLKAILAAPASIASRLTQSPPQLEIYAMFNG